MMSPHAPDDLHDRHHGDQAETTMSEASSAHMALSAVSLKEPITCAGCGGHVQDRFFLLAAGRAWHSVCLCCSVCHCELQTQPSLFWRDGAPYCHLHYCRLFGGGHCARCLQLIPSSELVMKSGALSFHQHCFCCQECKEPLVPGSLYCLQGQSLLCQLHCNSSVAPCLPEYPPYMENQHTGEIQTLMEGEESESSSEYRLVDSSTEGRVHRRVKRIRTCFRSEQIQVLESYFEQKQNPDGKDWNVLAQRTGLSKRVLQEEAKENKLAFLDCAVTIAEDRRLQVWFQNARARLRRSVTTDDQHLSPTPSTHLGSVTMMTCPLAPPSTPFTTTTIDQSQLSLLTAPLSPVPCPQDYDTHDAPEPGLQQVAQFHQNV